MKLDDILGLLFLLFFVILPAVNSLIKQSGKASEPKKAPTPTRAGRPAAGPQTRPSQTAPQAQGQASRPAPPAPTHTQQREALAAATASAALKEAMEKRAAALAEIRQQKLLADSVPSVSRPAPQQILNTGRSAILNGVVWHLVLSEPRGRHWKPKAFSRPTRKPKP